MPSFALLNQNTTLGLLLFVPWGQTVILEGSLLVK